MELTNIIIALIVIVALYLIIKLVTKIIIKVISLILVIGIAGFLLFYWNGGLLDLGNKDFMLYELEQKYCVEQNAPEKCDCIIKPLKADIESKYSDKEIEELAKSKVKSIRIITKSLSANKENIKNCLQERDKGEEWNHFLMELKEKNTN